MESRADLRAAARRLPYNALEHLSQHPQCPHMQQAEARREMRRRDKQHAAWFTEFMGRVAGEI